MSNKIKNIFCTVICLFFLTNTIACQKISSNDNKKSEVLKEDIVTALRNKTGDEFWFIYGLHKDGNISTNISYRGILYSNKLKELGATQGLEIGLESLDKNSVDLDVIVQNYNGLMRSLELNSIGEKKAKEIFGNKINLYNDWTMTTAQYNWIKERLWKKDLPYEEKNGARSTIVNYFVEDLDKLNNEEIKQKTFELAKFIYDEMNYKTGISVYVRDDKYFEDYNLVYYSIYKPFREREDIQKILGKIKKKEKITEKEKEELLRVFVKGSLDYENCHYKLFLISFDEKHEIPIEFKNISYESEIKNQQELFLKWRDEN